MKKNILKKSISCCLAFCAVLLCCHACGTETEKPDTIEDILNPRRNEQETETETSSAHLTEETQESTEYQSLFFPETNIPTEVPETYAAETETASEFVLPSETLPVAVTVPVAETETETAVPEISSAEWETAYREFLERKSFQRQISADVQEADTRFLLLYLNQDDIPELFIQTTMEVLIYSCHNGRVVYIDHFYPSHYTYNFYYRPYHNTLGSLQGSVMADGTYLEIYEFEDSPLSASGLVLKTTYCYPTRDYSYEIYAERGMNIDLDKAPELDVHPDRANNLGSSWITIPDVLEASPCIPRYEMTEEDLDALFGSKETDPTEETEETQEKKYAFR